MTSLCRSVASTSMFVNDCQATTSATTSDSVAVIATGTAAMPSCALRTKLALMRGANQGWVQLHKIISITITVIIFQINYNYTISITITLCGTKYIQHLLIMYFCAFC